MWAYHYIKSQAFKTKHMISVVRPVKTQHLWQILNAVAPTCLLATVLAAGGFSVGHVGMLLWGSFRVSCSFCSRQPIGVTFCVFIYSKRLWESLRMQRGF